MNEKRSGDDHIRICDPGNIELKEIHQVLDSDLHSKGIGAIR